MRSGAGALSDDFVFDEKKLMSDFKKFDTDKNGTLSRTELRSFMKNATEGKISSKDLETLITDADTSGDGVVSFDEFIGLLRALQMSRSMIQSGDSRELRAAFRRFDKDGTGVLEGSEIKYFAEEFGKKNAFSKGEVARLLKEADRNRDGKIDYDEFLRLATSMQCAKRVRNAFDSYELRQCFHQLDSDKNGFLSPGELRLFAMCLSFGNSVDMDDKRIKEMIRECDPDGDGQVDYVEFERYLVAYTAGQAIRDSQDPDEIDAIFGRLDIDSNHELSRPEVRVFLTSMVEYAYHNEPITPDMADKLMGDADTFNAKSFRKIVTKLKRI